MRGYCAPLLLVLLLSTCALAAQGHTRVVLTDAHGTPLPGLRAWLASEGAENATLSDGGGGFLVRAPPGTYVELLGSDPSALGRQYYASGEASEGAHIVLVPAGAVRGVVVDRLDNLVQGADIKLECQGAGPRAAQTDRFGSFSYGHVPAGSCTIYALRGDAGGFAQVHVGVGNATPVVVTLDRTLLDYDRGTPPWAFALLAIIPLAFITILFAIIEHRHRRHERAEAQGHGKEQEGAHGRAGQHPVEETGGKGAHEELEHAHSRRMEDIIETLSEKERAVVAFLMESQGAASQNKVSRALQIPKTSLRRTIDSLERKRIVSVERLGKFKKMRLTEWFLGK